MKKTKKYTGLFIISPDKEDALEEVTGRIKTIITENGGKTAEEELMGKRELAYPIKKKEQAVYFELTFEADPENIARITRQYRIDNDILRTLIDQA